MCTRNNTNKYVIIIYLLFFFAFGFVFVVMVPILTNELTSFSYQVPEYVVKVKEGVYQLQNTKN